MTIPKELLDELLECCERPEDLLRNDGLMNEPKIKLIERMPGAELRRPIRGVIRLIC